MERIQALSKVGTAAAFLAGCVSSGGATPNPDRNPGIGAAEGAGGEALGASSQKVNILLPFPAGETWALTSSSHEGGSLDWAPWEPTRCASDGTYPVPPEKITGDPNSWVSASISGKIKEIRRKEDEDPGVLVIEDNRGMQVVYRHVLQTQEELKTRALKIDQQVKAGEPLIHPACVGYTSGVHVDTSVRINGEKVPAENVVYSGWETIPSGTEYNGTLVKKGQETRTANVYRCAPPDNATNPNCNGTRNDVTNTGETASSPKPAEESLDQPFVPDNPEKYARYQVMRSLLEELGGARVLGDDEILINKFDITEDQIEKLARGGSTEPIHFKSIYYVSVNPEDSRDKPTLYVRDPNGDIYQRTMRLIRGSFKELTLGMQRDGTIEVRNQEYVAWAGKIQISTAYQFGFVDVQLRGTLEDFERWKAEDYQSIMDEKIKKFSQLKQWRSSVKAYVYEDGDVECTVYGEVSTCDGGGFFSDYLPWKHDEDADNGNFLIEVES